MNIKELMNKIGVYDNDIIYFFDKYINKFSINDEDVLYLIANCYHESAGFKILSENLNYSESALISIFSYFKKNPSEAKKYARNQVEIGNRIYANRLGNGDINSGDGYKYRGRSYIQITGKQNYKIIGDMISLDLISKPDLLLSKEYAAASSCAFYYKYVNNSYSIEQSRLKINGKAMLGIEEVKKIYNKLKM